MPARSRRRPGRILLALFIRWARRRAVRLHVPIITFEGAPLFTRIEFAWPDEYQDGENGDRWHRPPWWRPFNVFLHWWSAQHAEEMHDHPRWSVTICLCGRLLERTPWEVKTLRPGSIVIRSRKAIHAFTIPPEHRRRTWTLFIVGRRDHPQNTYAIVQRGVV